ncbi:carbonic anhydrase [soil metagenome]
MTDVEDLNRRNADYAANAFVSGLKINPSGNLMVIGCVDPRVDPTHLLQLTDGEAAVVRNVGGRVTPATLRTLKMLSVVGAANAETRQPGHWNLVVLHHTDCGMTDLSGSPDLLAEYFEVLPSELDHLGVTDPVRSVQVDVEVVRRNLRAPEYYVSGLVYDVDTGHIETVVPPALLPES